MKRTSPCLLCAVVLGVVAALAPAQDKTHDALAHPRAKAKAENQRVLLLLTGGDATVGVALTKLMADYRAIGKLIRYEYQIAALPAHSLPGTAVRKRLGLSDLALPAMAALSTKGEVLGTLSAKQMVEGDSFSPDAVQSFVKKYTCSPADAREVLAAGLATAKKSKRHVFVYLSAPW